MILRSARHTNNIAALQSFYTEILNLKVLGRFNNHQDYDGVFLGNDNENWHLEFTQSKEPANHRFDEDDVLVFYPQTKTEYDSILSTIEQGSIAIHQAKNPYWNENGILIKDPDGYGIIISNLRVENQE